MQRIVEAPMTNEEFYLDLPLIKANIKHLDTMPVVTTGLLEAVYEEIRVRT